MGEGIQGMGKGFITIAIGEDYLERATFFSKSAKRFGFSTILMYSNCNVRNDIFLKAVNLESETTDRLDIWEFKKLCYANSEEFSRCAYCDADSLVIKNPSEMFKLVDKEAVHTPMGRAVNEHEKWAAPPQFTTKNIANYVGVPNNRQVFTLNGGFFLWRRDADAEKWFDDFNNNFNKIRKLYGGKYRVRDELCMSLSYALNNIECDKSDSSIGIWDAHDLKLDIENEILECKKAYYWQGHIFQPFIAHFGHKKDAKYEKCIQFLNSTWLPKISCQCVTYGRPGLLNEAVESFLRQDYSGEKELIILNDHPEIIIENPGIPDVHVINSPLRFQTIGEKRNACCALCSGDIIFPWDDDDISLPWRISYCIQEMKNKHYFKPTSLWYWKNKEISDEPRKAVAHAMGCFSKSLFNNMGGYPHIQSGQDQAIEDLFKKTEFRDVREIPVEKIFYVYRFPGTGSYHLSSHGYGKGLEQCQKFVDQSVRKGKYIIKPEWKQNYVDICARKTEKLSAKTS